MKILWLCNVIVPQIAKQLEITAGASGGWLVETLEALCDREDIEIGYCAPLKSNQQLVRASYKNVSFWGFNKENWETHIYDKSVESTFAEVLSEFQPDIVHIFGTEFAHALSMVRAFQHPEKTVVHLQGIISEYAKEYYAFLPDNVIHGYTFRDFLRQDNISQQAKKYQKRGRYEIQVLSQVGHVMGRTDWDYACAMNINPKLNYHYCMENLREEFSQGAVWEYETCQKYSIFMSQGSYPIKGLHLALEAVAQIAKEYPKVMLYVTGNDPRREKSFNEKLRESSYEVYIRKLISKLDIGENVVFLGQLNAGQMKEQYLKANVFVSASSIENSPNSVLEAMAVGTPVVSSFVGGVSSLLTHEKEGFLYQADAPYMLAYYVSKLFADVELAKRISDNERKRSKTFLNLDKNVQELISIYKEIEQD